MSIEYIQRFWDALAHQVEKLLGKYDSDAFFERFFSLSPGETSILGARVHLPTLTVPLENELKSIQPINQLTQASETLTARFDKSLGRLIGANLTSMMTYAAMVEANKNFEHSLERRAED